MNRSLVSPVKALLFDIGGVVIDFDFNRVFERWANDSRRSLEEIQSRFSFDHSFEAFERGEIEATDYFNSLRTTLGIDISDRQFEDGWNRVYIGEIDGMAELLEFAQQRLPIYALTNSNAVHKEIWSTQFGKILSRFRTVFNSSDIGKRKPDPEVFHFIADATGVDLHQMILYDDLVENIAGAQAVGMNTVHVTAISDVEKSFQTIFRTCN
ncbi:MAG: HAD-IA family hydrolase [Desulfobacteraceae bacterium]|jgi:putative hydrolase of the HAD superfamily